MSKIFTDETSFLELTDKVSIDSNSAQKINIDYDSLSIYRNWYLKDNNFYYFKNLKELDILKYLICANVAKNFSLDVPLFIIAKVDNQIGLASLNFRKSNVTYFYIKDYEIFPFIDLDKNLNFVRNFFSIEDNYLKFVNQILNLVGFHIYTGLIDINGGNILFQVEKDGFSLAPLYDLDYSFRNQVKNQKFYYHSYFSNFSIPSNTYENLISQFPFFKEILNLFFNIDINTIINKIAEDNHLFINELYQDYFKREDEIKKDFIRNLHL